MSSTGRERVFLNVPFDRAYEPLFIALIGTLVFLGREPQCVLQVREGGDGRLARIFGLMRTCPISIHDFSRVGTPVRFNMPFELGLASALKLSDPTAFEVFVMDAKPFRIDRTLSDYKGRDVLIHHNRSSGIIACLLDVFVVHPSISASNVRRAVAALAVSAETLRRELKMDSLFRPAIFNSLLIAATKIGNQHSLIPR